MRKTLSSLKSYFDGALHSIDFSADYHLEEALSSELTDIRKLCSFAGNVVCVQMDPIAAPAAYSVPEFGCSSFLCENKEHPGSYLFGRNFDDKNPMTPVVIRTTPTDGYSSVGILDCSWIRISDVDLEKAVQNPDAAQALAPHIAAFPYLILDGVNEKGLAISLLKLDKAPAEQQTGKYALMPNTAMRLVLDRAATVEEAIALFRAYDMQVSHPLANYHFLLGDAKGGYAVLEYCRNELVVIREPAVTNFYLAQGYEELTGQGHGMKRYRILTDVLKTSNHSLSHSEASDLLKRISQHRRETPSGKTGSYTQWSALYDLEKKDAQVLFAPDHMVFSLKGLFV